MMVRAGGSAQLCVETIGDRADPAVILVGAATWSMDWWEDDLCHRLAARGRLVVRYDQRDTGGSTSYPRGAPGYTGADLVRDVVAVLDGIGIERTHVVGLSMGGGVAQRMAIEHRARVASLTLLSTSPIDPGVGALPGPTPEILATFSSAAPVPAWHDREAVIEHIVAGERPYAGPGSFDASRVRTLAGRVFDRTDDMGATMTNHFLLEPGSSEDHRSHQLAGVPTLVLHGTADPLFPIEHGEALAASIPGARLLPLEGVGHQLPPPHLWSLVVDAIVEHTSGGPSGSPEAGARR